MQETQRLGFDLWVGTIPWGRKWQPTPVFLPGESCGKRSLAGYSPCGSRESYLTKQLSTGDRLQLNYSLEVLCYNCFSSFIVFLGGSIGWQNQEGQFHWTVWGIKCHCIELYKVHCWALYCAPKTNCTLSSQDREDNKIKQLIEGSE